MTDKTTDKLKAELAGYAKVLTDSVPNVRGDPASYSGGAYKGGLEIDAGHLLYLVNRALEAGSGMSLPETASLVRHGLRALGLLEEKAQAPGMMPVRVNVVLATRLDRSLCVLVRDVVMPAGVIPHHLKFPDIDPERRLPVLEDLGVAVRWAVSTHEYDFGTGVLCLHLAPVMIHPRLSEESVALVIGMYRAAGWEYRDSEARQWPTLFAQDKAEFKAACPPHAIIQQLFGPAVPADQPPAGRRRRKRKRRDDPGGQHGGEDHEGGEDHADGDAG